jgi:hypothetical protein
LDAQVDLDRVPAGGLTIFRNAAALPTAYVGTGSGWKPVPLTGDLGAIARRVPAGIERIPPPEDGAAPVATGGDVVLADQFDPAWRIDAGGRDLGVQRAFGWAIESAERAPAGIVSFSYGDQWARTTEMAVLGILWLAALWITRRPGSA